jgi:hypothetical protein
LATILVLTSLPIKPGQYSRSDYQMISFLVTSMMQAYYFVFGLYRALPLPVEELQQLATGTC